MRGSVDEAWLSVRMRAVGALALIVVALPLAAGIGAITNIRNELIERVQVGQLATARALGSDVARSIEFSISLAQTAGRRPGLVGWVSSGDSDGQLSVLRNIYGTTPLYRSVAVYDSAGNLLSAFPREPQDLPPETLAATSMAVMSATPSGSDARIVVRAPVGEMGGPVVGIIVATVSLSKALPEVLTLRFGETGSVTLVDRQGRVLITGEPARQGQRLTSPENRRLIRDWAEGISRYYGPLVERREMAAFVPVPGRPWAVLVTQSEDEAFEGITDLQTSLLFGLALMVATGLVIAYLMWQTLGRYERGLRERIDEQKRLNDALDSFAARVAHDLRTPLGTIRMAAQLASREEGLSEGGRHSIGMVESNAVRGIQLVEDLLALAKASGTPNLQMVDIGSLASEAAGGVDGLHLSNHATDRRVVADPVALRQGLVNLFNNAAKYGSLNGRAEVTLTADEDEDRVVIRVADRGPGLSPQDVEAIFEPFRRGSMRSAAGGTGLGLFIVSAMAAAHGGEAWYEPREGGGAVFAIALPNRELPVQADQQLGDRVRADAF